MKEEPYIMRIMPAIIVLMVLVGFLAGGGYMLYNTVNATVENPKMLSLLDMFVVALIGAVGTATGFFLLTTQSSKRKDEMIHNSTATTIPTSQITSTQTQSTTEEPKLN